METLTYTLFKGPKRVTLKEEDMTTDKIGRIFQVITFLSSIGHCWANSAHSGQCPEFRFTVNIH